MMDHYFYTFDYMLENTDQWRAELWDRYQNAEAGTDAKLWYYKCWQSAYSFTCGLKRLIEEVGTG